MQKSHTIAIAYLYVNGVHVTHLWIPLLDWLEMPVEVFWLLELFIEVEADDIPSPLDAVLLFVVPCVTLDGLTAALAFFLFFFLSSL